MDTLFDPNEYGEATPARPKPGGGKPQMLVPRPPGYHLVTNTKGVQGFHRTKVPEAAMAQYGTVVTLCGIVGRRLGEYPREVPLCHACEAAVQR